MTLANKPFPFKAQRPVAMGTRGAVASAHPLASLAGSRILLDGGNAIDAMVATAAALNVCEPFMSGAAGVGMMLYHQPSTSTTKFLDFSGTAPYAASPDKFTPETQGAGMRSSLVPGNLAGWLAALDEYGTMSRDQVFAPAIEYAECGFPLTHFGSNIFYHCTPTLLKCPNAAATYLINGKAPAPGGVLRQPDLAKTFKLIIDQGADVLYQGEIAEAITKFMAEEDGLMTMKDLNDYKPRWYDPISSDYRDFTVTTAPPNSEAFQILETLNIVEGYDLKGMGFNSADYIHVLSEAMKIAVADRIRYSGDPDFTDVPVDSLISKEYAAERRKLVNMDKASISGGQRWTKNPPSDSVPAGKPTEYLPGLTTHFGIIDLEGNVVSVTQTLGNGFGCGRVVPGTGLALNNAVNWMEVDPACDTPNLIEGGKRWSVCLSPTQVYRDGKFYLSVSTPGSYGILQTTVQMLLTVLEFGANIQGGIEAPRFTTGDGVRLSIEDRVPGEIRDELSERGHAFDVSPPYSAGFGGGQAVMIDPDSGARMAGGAPRRDGYGIAF